MLNLAYVKGWYIIIPSFAEIIVLAFLVIGMFYLGRGSALHYLKKYHLPQIMDDDVKEIVNENKELYKAVNRLKEKNKLYVNTLEGVRHLTRRIEE